MVNLHYNFLVLNTIANDFSQGQAEVDGLGGKELSEGWDHAANVALGSQSSQSRAEEAPTEDDLGVRAGLFADRLCDRGLASTRHSGDPADLQRIWIFDPSRRVAQDAHARLLHAAGVQLRVVDRLRDKPFFQDLELSGASHCSSRNGVSPAVILSSAFSRTINKYDLSTLMRVTYLVRNGLDDANSPVVIIYGRPVAGDRGRIAVLIDDARLS